MIRARRLAAGVVPTVAVALPTLAPSAAGQSDISPALRARAISLCTDDAMRFCSSSLFDEGRAVRCISAHRPELSIPCRVAYDQVARLLRR